MSSDPVEILIGLPIWILIILFSHPVILIAVVFLLFYWARHGERRRGTARTDPVFSSCSWASAGLDSWRS
jgi:hypothetical protein